MQQGTHKVARGDAEEVVRTRYGAFFRSSKRRVDLAYDSEEAEIEIFHKWTALIEADTVIDIGANIGLYSIYSTAIASVRRIVAVEASAETFTELEKNLTLQESPAAIEAHNIAGTSKERVMQFFEYGALAGHNGLVDTSFVGERMDHRVVEVTGRPMDLVVPERGRTLAVKIDVEGHEIEVLDGARDLLEESSGFLQVEILSEDNVRAVTKQLDALGYDAVGYVKNDHYFLHRSLAEKTALLSNVMFQEIRKSLAALLEARRMRRSVLRAARKMGEAGAPIVKSARFGRDPVLKP